MFSVRSYPTLNPKYHLLVTKLISVSKKYFLNSLIVLKYYSWSARQCTMTCFILNIFHRHIFKWGNIQYDFHGSLYILNSHVQILHALHYKRRGFQDRSPAMTSHFFPAVSKPWFISPRGSDVHEFIVLIFINYTLRGGFPCITERHLVHFSSTLWAVSL